MISLAVSLALGLVLVAAAVLKLAAPRRSEAALATFGLGPGRLRWSAWGAVVAAELVLAGGVIAGLDAAAYAAAVLMALFAAELGIALRRGQRGAPCACFGARSTVSPAAVARSGALAIGFAVLPSLPSSDVSKDGWLGLGLGVALLAIAGLTIAVLALAREVGMLRLALGPQGALEVPEEGPELGTDSGLAERFASGPETRLALAVFSSEGCVLCRSLEPQIMAFARDPMVSVVLFDEVSDPDTWRALNVPGSPFAVALDLDGTVLAKGTFNSLAQLESVLGTAERRKAEAHA